MILTVTANASVDITYVLDDLRQGTVNRVDDVTKTAGGKGLNVSRVLNQVGADLVATGIVGGTTGEFIERQLDAKGIGHDFFHVHGESRNNISIVCQGATTEILEKGSGITASEAHGFESFFEQIVDKADTVSISGSLPKGLDSGTYARLIRIASEMGKRSILDASGEALRCALEAPVKPWLIKPNQDELAFLLGTEIPGNDEALMALLDSSLFDGVSCIVLTLGADGALVRASEGFYRVRVPSGKRVNPVGSGDSVIAGMSLGIDRGESLLEIIRRGMTYGVLNALDSMPGHLALSRFDEISSGVVIERL